MCPCKATPSRGNAGSQTQQSVPSLAGHPGTGPLPAGKWWGVHCAVDWVMPLRARCSLGRLQRGASSCRVTPGREACLPMAV